jgi:hypothetical protein
MEFLRSLWPHRYVAQHFTIPPSTEVEPAVRPNGSWSGAMKSKLGFDVLRQNSVKHSNYAQARFISVATLRVNAAANQHIQRWFVILPSSLSDLTANSLILLSRYHFPEAKLLSLFKGLKISMIPSPTGC